MVSIPDRVKPPPASILNKSNPSSNLKMLSQKELLLQPEVPRRKIKLNQINMDAGHNNGLAYMSVLILAGFILIGFISGEEQRLVEAAGIGPLPISAESVDSPVADYNSMMGNLITDLLEDTVERLKKSKINNNSRQVKHTLRFGRGDPLSPLLERTPFEADWSPMASRQRLLD